MAKSAEGSTKVLVGAEVLNPPLPDRREQPTTTDGPITFGMYCAVRGVPVQNQPGMRAFTTVQAATLREWDTIFRRY